MFTVKFPFMEYAPYIPMHLIRDGDNSRGNFCASYLDYCNSLLQYFIIF